VSIPDRPIFAVRVNGLGRAPIIKATSGMDDEWDEEVVIGGKKMPGWLEVEEGRREVERVGKMLGNMDA
jgi:hypothetical protein